MTIRLLVADPHPAVAAGARQFVAGTEIEVASQAADGVRAVKLATEEAPDIVLMAVKMPREDGLSALARIKQARPDLPVVMTACDRHPVHLAQAYRLGASGLLLKDFSPGELVAAIRRVASGGDIWSREEVRRVTGVFTSEQMTPSVDVALTPREYEVLRLIIGGLTNRRISEQLDISYETVKEHVQHIIRKIGVSDRTQAAVWAARNGLG
jgi:DNA-binding NarL/FixJ family response regulator